MRYAQLRNQDGFTLVEMLVAISIFLLILVGVFQIFDPSNKAYMATERKLGVQQNGRVAMDTIVRQIRMTGYFPENIDTNPANDLSNRIQAASESALAVAGDLDGSGSSSVFTFCRDGGGLKVVKGPLGTAASYTCSTGSVLAESVTSLSFAYFDSANNPIPNPPPAAYNLDNQALGGAPTFVTTTERAAVARIVIKLTARENVPGGQPAQTYDLASDVRLRNP
jgi:prepilin-type N-terminal cleavage/methylation domain-containing protein